MTNRIKLIVGGVVILGGLFLYDRNKKMKAVAQAKADAEADAEAEAKREADAIRQGEDAGKIRGKAIFKRPMGAVSLSTMNEII